MARDVWNFVVGPEIGAGEGRWPSAVCGLDLDHLPRPHTRAQRSAHEPLACVRAQLVVLLAEVGKLEDMAFEETLRWVADREVRLHSFSREREQRLTSRCLPRKKRRKKTKWPKSKLWRRFARHSLLLHA